MSGCMFVCADFEKFEPWLLRNSGLVELKFGIHVKQKRPFLFGLIFVKIYSWTAFLYYLNSMKNVTVVTAAKFELWSQIILFFIKRFMFKGVWDCIL